MFPNVASTAGLTPDPVAICTHINRLSRELRLARRLLRVTVEARERDERQESAPSAKREVTNVAR